MPECRSFWLKLERAYEHLDCLRAEASAWIEAKPYGIVDEPDPEPPPQAIGYGIQPRRIRIASGDLVPNRISVIVGDCLFNLRSALDHLALALAQSHSPAMTSRQVAASEFPVFDAAAKFSQAEGRKIGCIAPAAAAIIESLQPYQGVGDIAKQPLWQIHELNRVDKHRMLTVCAAAPLVDGQRVLILPYDAFENFGDAYAYWRPNPPFNFHMNAIWVRWAAVAIDPNKEVRVKPEVPVEIIFDQGGPAPLEPVIPALQALCDFVSDSVMVQLSQFSLIQYCGGYSPEHRLPVGKTQIGHNRHYAGLPIGLQAWDN